jgi:ankyrin repeat protein
MDILQAILNNSFTQVKELLEKGANPNIEIRGTVPLSYVCYKSDDSEMIQLLLEYGADPTFNASEALRMACFFGHTKIVKLLLRDGRADPTCFDNHAIKISLRNSNIDVVKALLQDGRVDIHKEYKFSHVKQEIADMLIAYKYRVDGQEYQKMKNLLK